MSRTRNEAIEPAWEANHCISAEEKDLGLGDASLFLAAAYAKVTFKELYQISLNSMPGDS
ncbi:MAG: hypothetical protein P8L85_08505 [Rubripirellula sp.]|nr:hypothetical protein [Rubripirellula sp.]